MSTPRRTFTPAEATRTLPYVRRVITDIVAAHRQICEVYSKLDRFAGGESESLERQIRSLLAAREEYVLELEQVGCEFKDYQLGLVDFPARLGDRLVYLCWRPDEPEVQFWHELRAGFGGRRPIEAAMFAETHLEPSERSTRAGTRAGARLRNGS